MGDEIREYLNTRSEELLLFKVKPTNSLVEKVLSLKVDALEMLDDITLSKYIIALSQYLVYLTSQMNKAKVMYKIYSRKVEELFIKTLEEHGITGKNIAERKVKALDVSDELKSLQESADKYELEVSMCDDYDKQITTLVNALKRELTRRENEKLIIRKERG